MTSTYLKITPMTSGQSNKELTSNDGDIRLEKATQKQLAVDMSVGNVLLSQDQFTTNFVFVCSGQTANRDLTVPTALGGAGANTAHRFFAVHNSEAADFTVTVKQDVSGKTVTVLPGESATLIADGTDVRRADASMDLGAFAPGVPTSNLLLFQWAAIHPFTLKTGLPGSQGFFGAAATASASYPIAKNGTGIGSLDVAASGTVATFTFSADVDFAIGDRLTLSAPASPDATAADLSFAFNSIRR